MAKKVVIIIVEGDSDELLLIERLRNVFGTCEIRFEIQRGDILNTSVSKRAIKEVIGDLIKEILKKRKYNPTDILSIIHIMDTDGCMISNEHVVVDEGLVTKTYYDVDSIKVNCELQKMNIETRNQNRFVNIETMNSVSTVVGKKYSYQLFYFSRNLEHVIFDNPNPDDKTKYDDVERFIESLVENIEAFLDRYMPIKISANYDVMYNESWRYIRMGTNSLKRYTNVPLAFQYIKSKLG